MSGSPRHDLVAKGRFDWCSEHDFVVGAASVASSLRVRFLNNIGEPLQLEVEEGEGGK
jgi:hypothetical protein